MVPNDIDDLYDQKGSGFVRCPSLLPSPFNLSKVAVSGPSEYTGEISEPVQYNHRDDGQSYE